MSSMVFNMVAGGGGGSADFFMELIGATEMVEMTYTPTSDASNFFLPNTSGRGYKGLIVDAETHSTTAGYTRYVDRMVVLLDDTSNNSRTYPTGRFTLDNAYEYIQSYSGAYIQNNLSNGIYFYLNYNLYFKAGKTYNIKLFY